MYVIIKKTGEKCVRLAIEKLLLEKKIENYLVSSKYETLIKDFVNSDYSLLI